MRFLGKKDKKNVCEKEEVFFNEVKKEKQMEAENEIKILGSGCAKCHQLENSVKSAVNEMEMHCRIEHVTDFAQIAAYGVMSTPALVFNEKVVSYGKVLSVEEVMAILEKEMERQDTK